MSDICCCFEPDEDPAIDAIFAQMNYICPLCPVHGEQEGGGGGAVSDDYHYEALTRIDHERVGVRVARSQISVDLRIDDLRSPLTPREARTLAAHLLLAADEAERVLRGQQ